ncbi:MAG: hypothetical protein GC185_04570 [Alphaproteobacteria bacterium]|nr:hypothetical protein [Alphaproteobacteria bacterium]
MLEKQESPARRAQSAASSSAPSPVTAPKAFHLNEILSLTTGLQLAQEGAAAIHRLVAFVMQTEAGPAGTAAAGETVKRCLEEQLPFLRDVRVSEVYEIYQFNPSPGNPYLRMWLEMQELRYGDMHDLRCFEAWQAKKKKRRHNRAQEESVAAQA